MIFSSGLAAQISQDNLGGMLAEPHLLPWTGSTGTRGVNEPVQRGEAGLVGVSVVFCSSQAFQRQVHERRTQLELVNKQYRRLARENRTDAASSLRDMVQEGNQRWDGLQRRVAAIIRRLRVRARSSLRGADHVTGPAPSGPSGS